MGKRKRKGIYILHIKEYILAIEMIYLDLEYIQGTFFMDILSDTSHSIISNLCVLKQISENYRLGVIFKR